MNNATRIIAVAGTAGALVALATVGLLWAVVTTMEELE